MLRRTPHQVHQQTIGKWALAREVRTMSNLMRRFIIVAAVATLPLSGSAQNPPSQSTTTPQVVDGKGLYWSIDDVKKALRAGEAIPLPRTPRYWVTVQNRLQEKPLPSEVHSDRAQFYVVLDGSGTIVVGGDVPNSNQISATDRRGQLGQSIAGGTPHRVKTGDMLLIPKNTWHAAQPDPGGLRYVLVNLMEP
jgi:mannose-6-phosphate isomerase-like protein (cupin superfamily)